MANFSEDLRKILMAGVGAVSTAAEKLPEALDTLAKRGEETLEQGKVLNEQLRHEIKQAVKENVTVVETAMDKDGVLNAMNTMSAEELDAVEKKIAELKTRKADDDAK
ncbi:MAG: hypothetical protein PHI98_14375 [Eubacteriales bacterium]|nr:hypothetical protein [Eubacteriales bacterium]